MINEPKPMKEIHEIQEKIYEETKGMTTRELLDYFHRGTDEATQKLGLKVRRLSRHKRAA